MATGRFKPRWPDDRRLRRRLLVVDVGLIAFWIYSVAYIVHHPAEKGSDGFEVFMVVPMTLIALCLSLPALLLLISIRTVRIGAWITAVAVVANALLGDALLWNGGLRRGDLWPLW